MGHLGSYPSLMSMVSQFDLPTSLYPKQLLQLQVLHQCLFKEFFRLLSLDHLRCSLLPALPQLQGYFPSIIAVKLLLLLLELYLNLQLWSKPVVQCIDPNRLQSVFFLRELILKSHHQIQAFDRGD